MLKFWVYSWTKTNGSGYREFEAFQSLPQPVTHQVNWCLCLHLCQRVLDFRTLSSYDGPKTPTKVYDIYYQSNKDIIYHVNENVS